jgi:hypothetical protein
LTPGVYRLRAVFQASETAGKLESAPIRITIGQPKGADLQVWNTLRTDSELGYFIQTGSPKGDPESERSKRLAEVLNSLASSYPESRQAPDIRSSLGRYRTTLEKLREKGLVKN